MLVVGTNVLVGLMRNIQDDDTGSRIPHGITVVVGICLVPVVCLLETVAVARGILFREDHFFVVRKT
jgi:hypothetical protein